MLNMNTEEQVKNRAKGLNVEDQLIAKAIIYHHFELIKQYELRNMWSIFVPILVFVGFCIWRNMLDIKTLSNFAELMIAFTCVLSGGVVYFSMTPRYKQIRAKLESALATENGKRIQKILFIY